MKTQIILIDKGSNEIAGATYLEMDINGDNETNDYVFIPKRKIGDYQITIIPEPNAEPTDTYTLKISAGDTTIVLAEYVSISDIPTEPYVFESKNLFPIASFNYSPENPTINQTITFNASSAYDPDGNRISYEWNFGDGNIINTTNEIITHSYCAVGDYIVSLKVTDDYGAVNSTSKSVIVAEENLTNWNYITNVVINENSGTKLTDYQVEIELNSSNFDFSKAKSDGADIRFYDGNENELNYWIEEWNYSLKTAKIWVKVPNIPANENVALQMYYGNPDASAMSNGIAVFEFFDDFEGGDVDTSKWTVDNNGGYYSVSNSNLYLNSSDTVGNYVRLTADFSPLAPFYIETYY